MQNTFACSASYIEKTAAYLKSLENTDNMRYIRLKERNEADESYKS